MVANPKKIIIRKPGWEIALSAFLADRRTCPFAWGTNDCCLFACDAALAITGMDLAADFRGHYTDRASAGAVIRAFCGGGVQELALKIARQFGIQQWPAVGLARRGDIVLFAQRRRWTLGVVSLNGYELLAPAAAGLARLPLSQSERAWRIG